jgi:ATPase subunit of ABC transporter with duplicated ATPase domains
MQGVSKTVPPKRTILENISLSFFPGAKIGVLGLNGSGKSSLLRIMAGVDTEFDGEARAQKNINVGYLPQEPQLDESLDVRGNVELGMGETMAMLSEYNTIADRFAEPMSDDEMNDGKLIVLWRLPRMHCACRPGMRTSVNSPAGNDAG